MSEKFRSEPDSEIDLKPFINFLVVLIPVLMISAEFSKIAIVEASSSLDRGSTTDSLTTSRRSPGKTGRLDLTVIVSDSTITIGSNNGFLPTVYYREYHTYVSRANRTQTVTVAYDARTTRKTPVNPQTGKPFGLDERETIGLYVIDEKHAIAQCLYAKNGGLVTDEKGVPRSSVRVGEKVYIQGPVRTLVTVGRSTDFSLKPMSAYDDLRNRLGQVKRRAGEAPDGQSIRIAAESSVIYDKIIQLMDVARGSGFPDISIAKLRG
jgi:biopolymer transport protein ExbD